MLRAFTSGNLYRALQALPQALNVTAHDSCEYPAIIYAQGRTDRERGVLLRIELLSPEVKRWFTIVMVVMSVIAIAFNVAEVRSGNLRIYDGLVTTAKDIGWSMPAVFMVVVAVVNRRVLKAIMLQQLGLKKEDPAERHTKSQAREDAGIGGESSHGREKAGKTDHNENRADEP